MGTVAPSVEVVQASVKGACKATENAWVSEKRLEEGDFTL